MVSTPLVSTSREVAKFVATGVLSNVINFSVYVTVVALTGSVLVASGVGYWTGALNSYALGRLWVFQHGREARVSTSLAAFVVLYVFGSALMSGTTVGLVSLGVDYRLAWLFAAGITFLNNFLGAKFIVFRARKVAGGDAPAGEG